MPTIEVDLPDEIVSEFEQIAEDEFTNREEAVEQLLSAGIRTYTREFEEPTETDLSEEYADDIWDTADGPMGGEDDHGDDYTF